jgi:hypothetical protein
MRRFSWSIPLLLVALSCEELKEPLPTAPPPPAPPGFSQYQIVGHWETTSSQGRRIAFDVTSDGRVMNGRINFHHDCNTGRWRATLDGFETQVVDDSFITSFNWGNEEDGVTRTGFMTVSGRFEGDRFVKGGFVSSVNDVRMNGNPTGDVCPSIEGHYEGIRE